MDTNLMQSLSKEQLMAFVSLQQSNNSAASSQRPVKRAKAKAQPVNIMNEPISDHYKYFFDLGLKVIRAILVNTNQCEGLSDINIQTVTMEQAYWVLWYAYGVYTHTKIPKAMSPTVQYICQQLRRCYIHKGIFLFMLFFCCCLFPRRTLQCPQPVFLFPAQFPYLFGLPASQKTTWLDKESSSRIIAIVAVLSSLSGLVGALIHRHQHAALSLE